ncbi:hypothetical protein CCMSSC00406_0001046 [Pleurotus cornucopiae]|uniref:Uncharacterized protein n=1 Tax=Pleurotus cornucopiae TaxID=5321 RepID=A0ACB7IL93_PLECO|nr:hypothetical protein CCMSSC00406_0001046 [Pleurotus cornucopiae]
MTIVDPEKLIALDGATSFAAFEEDWRQRTKQRRRKRFVRLGVFLIAIAGFLSYYRQSALQTDQWAEVDYDVRRKPLSNEESEQLYLSVPNADSALEASGEYATHPHLAGSMEDFADAKVILELFQDAFHAPAPKKDPIFDAGSYLSRASTLLLTSPLGPKRPTAWIDTYHPVMNIPLDRTLSIIGENGDVTWNADLVEDGDPGDPEAHKYKDYVPTWHGLSKDGEAEGQLIYANYGTKEDYDELVAAGTNFTGKIVITRYGAIFRGLKILGAQELGAAGVLIYSDPRDDGDVSVEKGYAPWPAGPARNPTSVQRGSVQYLSLYPGDPTTPGYPAYKDAKRTEGENIPKIPSLPISWKNAERLLEEIDGLYVNGAFSENAHLNGKSSNTSVKLVNHVDTKVTPIWNTMAAIPGHVRDQVILVGCHRDAWVMGAADPTSGTVSLHEVIRGFGELLDNGWKPLRTILFASWDAEEYGLIGSTEFGEDFSQWISKHVVSYINVDVSVAGSRWGASASPSLAHLIKQAALDVPHPTKPGKTLWDAQSDVGPFTGNFTSSNAEDGFAKKRRRKTSSLVGPLGSGSDYTVFLQRLGVSSVDQSFGPTSSDAVYHYHSIYDSQHWQETYGDPDFSRHIAVAQHLGLMVLRFANSIILPLNTTQYTLELYDYVDRVEDVALSVGVKTPDLAVLRDAINDLEWASLELDEEKVEAERELREILENLPEQTQTHSRCKRRNGILNRIATWIKFIYGVQLPERHQEDPSISRPEDFYHLLASDEELQALEFALETDQPHEMLPRFPPNFPIWKFLKAARRVGKVNQKLIAYERGFISKGGIKDREWYKHLVVAPGKWLGYGATTLPALTEALTLDQNVTLAAEEATRLVDLIDQLTDTIKPIP